MEEKFMSLQTLAYRAPPPGTTVAALLKRIRSIWHHSCSLLRLNPNVKKRAKRLAAPAQKYRPNLVLI